MESHFDSDTSWTNIYERLDSLDIDLPDALQFKYFGYPVFPFGDNFDLYIDSLPGSYYYHTFPFGDKELDWDEEDFERYIPYDLKLPDVFYNYPELEDLPEFKKVLPLNPPNLKYTYRYRVPYQRDIDRAESIMKGELLKDGIITKDSEYVVYIDSDMMSVNGVKQPKEIYKKYKRLLETAMGEEIKKGVTYFY